MTSPDPIPLGAYRGFGMVMRFDSISREYRVTLSNKMSYTVSLGTDLYGNITRLDNALAGIEAKRGAACEELENAKQQLATAQEQVNRPFPQEDELRTKSARLDELNIALNLDKPDNEDMDSGEELPKVG